MPPMRLPEWLLRDGLLTQAQAHELMSAANRSCGALWQRIVDAGWLSDEQVGEAIARRFDVPFRRISRKDVHPRLFAVVPRETWAGTLTAPLDREGMQLILGCCDPVDLKAFDQITVITGLHISPVVVPPADLRAAVADPPASRSEQVVVPEPRRWRVFRTDDPERTLVEIRFDEAISGPTGHVQLLGAPDAVTLVEHYLADPFGQRPLQDHVGFRYGPFFYDPWDVHETLQALAGHVENMGVEVVEG